MGYKLTGMYIRPNGTELQIGPPAGWRPGANTVCYYPLDSTNTVNDLSGNGYNLTNNGVTFGTYGGVDCAYFNGGYLSYSSIPELPQGNSDRTVSCYVYGEHTDKQIFQRGPTGNDYPFGAFIGGSKNVFVTTYYGPGVPGTADVTGSWHHVVITHDGTDTKIYVDGQVDGSGTVTLNTTGTEFYIGYCTWVSWNFDKYISKFIVEDICWSAQDISDYFDQTKGDYGIS